MISFYNEQLKEFQRRNNNQNLDEFIDNDPTKISWSADLKKDVQRERIHHHESKNVSISMYRPYCKQKIYFSHVFNERQGEIPDFLPNDKADNLLICITGKAASKQFSALITNVLPDFHLHDTSKCFPLYSYKKQTKTDQLSLLTKGFNEDYLKKENIPNDILTDFKKTYKDPAITKEDIFYYVYGILHSPEYKRRFECDLKKMLPRIPYAQDFWAFSKAGRQLAQWHLNYETIEPYPLQEYNKELVIDAAGYYRVSKMTFGRGDKAIDQTTIVYNNSLILLEIPLEAYQYIVNGKSALEWIMDRYQVTKDKESGITNDPNDWSEDPRYIVDLVKRIVRVSIETVKVVNSLPDLNERM